MLFLVASLVALGAGPVVYRLLRSRQPWMTFLDGFVLVAISGLVLLRILPPMLGRGDWLMIVFALAGLVIPTIAEHGFRRAEQTTFLGAFGLALVGLLIHAMVDGAALTPGGGATTPNAHGSQLPYAIVLHRVPIGLTLWWLVRPFGVVAPLAVVSLVAASTVGGFALGPKLTSALSGQAVLWFEAFVGGSLLHVVFHRPHLSPERGATPRYGWREGLGAVLAAGFLAAIVGGGAWAEGGLAATRAIRTFGVLALESAPALLLAHVAAGILSAFLPESSVRWMRAGGGWGRAFRGMAVGLPMPICSCGVVPLYGSLIRRGAPPTAAIAFLIATPELGLDAVFISIPLLGGPMTLLRVATAILLALLVGRVVGGWIPARPAPPDGTTATKAVPEQPAGARLRGGLRWGLGEAVDHTAPWILLGLGVAAIAEPLVSASRMTQLGPGLDVLLFTLLGIPAYVCASAATPLVAALLSAGVSPGAAMAFLLTGPATNVTTFGVIAEYHGRKAAVAFSVAMIGFSAGIGYAVNAAFPALPVQALDEVVARAASPLQMFSVAALSIVYLTSFLRRGVRRFFGEIFLQGGGAVGPHAHAA